MFAGPLVVRELITSPRNVKHFGLRAGYVAILAILLQTSALTTFESVITSQVGDVARFGSFIFGLMCAVQLVVVLAMSLILSAGSVAQEKDKRTLLLLLMTDLRTTELVVGKTLASLLPVFVMIGVSIPVMCLLRLLGGITLNQILCFELTCLATSLVAGSWGTLVGYWREKTFQILAMTFMGAGLFVGVIEILSALTAGTTLGTWIACANPFRVLSSVLNPLSVSTGIGAQTAFGMSLWLAVAVILWTIACRNIRIWNPSRRLHIQQEEDSAEATADESAREQAARKVWDWPIIWREMNTQAYGRKVGLIKAGYFLLAVFCILYANWSPADAPLVMGVISVEGFVFVVLAIVGLILINAQAVTALTSERDGQTLELLLVTEISAKEFIFGKLGGVLFNTKEVIIVPVLFAITLFARGFVGGEGLVFLLIGFLVLVMFAAMLGLHSALSFHISRSAILNSLGTMFLLFVGIFICMILMVEARTSFILQLPAFGVFICGGSLALWSSLTHRVPSQALTWGAVTLPFLTYYAIVSFLLDDSFASFAAITVTYGFTTLAILVPAISAFDVALGRTTIDRA